MDDDLEARIRQRWDAGDFHGATEIALRGYGPAVYRFLVKRLGRSDHADEVFGQLGEDLWRGIQGFQWRSKFSTWMYTLARNGAYRWQRSPANQPARRESLSRISEIVAEVRSSTLQILRSSVKDRFAELRQRLPPEDQTLLLLRVSEELAWKEVARVLADDMTLEGQALERASNNARQRFVTITRRLRRMAEEEGLLERREDR